MIFGLLHHNLRSQGIQCGLSEWLCFLQGLSDELVVSLSDLYGFGRTVLCTTEAQFDAYDIAFSASFDGWLRSQTPSFTNAAATPTHSVLEGLNFLVTLLRLLHFPLPPVGDCRRSQSQPPLHSLHSSSF